MSKRKTKRTEIELELTPELRQHLETLLKTGLWGATIEEVASRLITDQLKEEIARGTITLHKG